MLYQDLNGNGKFDTPATINVGQRTGGYFFNTNYRSGIDNVASSILAQKTFSLSVSYTF
jgi:hypothetical protein